MPVLLVLVAVLVERLLGLGSQKTATSPSSFLRPPPRCHSEAGHESGGMASPKAYISVDEEINQIISGSRKGSTERAFLAAAL